MTTHIYVVRSERAGDRDELERAKQAAENAVLYQGTTLVVPQLIENTSGCHEWPV
jgi:hypothetical protein